MYAEIAIGATLPLHFYEGLHDQLLLLPATDEPCPDGQLDNAPINVKPEGGEGGQ